MATIKQVLVNYVMRNVKHAFKIYLLAHLVLKDIIYMEVHVILLVLLANMQILTVLLVKNAILIVQFVLDLIKINARLALLISS